MPVNDEITSIIEDGHEQYPTNQPEQITPKSKRTPRVVSRALAVPILVGTLLAGGAIANSTKPASAESPNKAIASIVTPNKDEQPETPDTPTSQETLKWENIYHTRVIEEEQKLRDEIKEKYGLEIEYDVTAKQRRTAGLPILNPAERLQFTSQILEYLRFYPPELTKNLSPNIWIARDLDDWSLKYEGINGQYSYGMGITLDDSTLYGYNVAENTTYHHELTHAVLASLLNHEEYYKQFEDLYPDCDPYSYSYDFYKNTVCHPDSFEELYGTVNPPEDTATIAETFFHPDELVETLGIIESNSDYQDIQLYKKKIDLIKDGYLLASDGVMTEEVWESIFEEVMNGRENATQLQEIGNIVGVSPRFLVGYFPNILESRLNDMGLTMGLEAYTQLILDDVKSNVPPELYDFILRIYSDKFGSVDEFGLRNLLYLLSTDVTKLDPELMSIFDKQAFEDKESKDREDYYLSITSLLSLDPEFFEYEKERILNSNIPEDERFDFVIQIKTISNFLAFYDLYAENFDISKADYYKMVIDAMNRTPNLRADLDLSSAYGRWIYDVADLNYGNVPQELASPLGFRIFSNTIKRSNTIAKPKEGIKTAYQLAITWTEMFPDQDINEMFDYLIDIDAPNDIDRTRVLNYLLEHVTLTYPPEERAEKLESYKTVVDKIQSPIQQDIIGDNHINLLESLLDAEVEDLLYGDKTFHLFISEFIDTLSKTENARLDVTTLNGLAQLNGQFTPEQSERYRSLISQYLLAADDTFLRSSFISFINSAYEIPPYEHNMDGLLDVLEDAITQPIPSAHIRNADVRILFPSPELEDVLRPILEKAKGNYRMMEFYSDYHTAFSKVMNADIAQEEKDKLISSIKYLGTLPDEGQTFKRVAEDVYEAVNSDNPIEFIKFMQAKIHMSKIFENNGLPQFSIPSLSNNMHYVPAIIRENERYPHSVDGILKLDQDTATTYDVIFETSIGIELNPLLVSGDISEDDIQQVRSTYQKLFESGVYSPIVAEKLTDLYFEHPSRERIYVVTNAIMDSISESPEERKAGQQKLLSFLEEASDAEPEVKKIQTILAEVILNPDSTFEDIYSAYEKVAGMSDRNSPDDIVQSYAESEAASIIQQLIRAQGIDKDELLGNQQFRDAITLYVMFGSNLMNGSNYNLDTNESAPRLSIALLMDALPTQVPRNHLIYTTFGGFVTAGLYGEDSYNQTEIDRLKSIYEEIKKANPNGIRDSLNPQGLFNIYQADDMTQNSDITPGSKFEPSPRG